MTYCTFMVYASTSFAAADDCLLCLPHNNNVVSLWRSFVTAELLTPYQVGTEESARTLVVLDVDG